MEYTPIVTGTAIGVGMGLVDRGHIAHEQLLYRGGGLAASLAAQHQGWGPANVAPAAVAAFAAHFAARALAIYVFDRGKASFGQKLTNVTAAGQKLTNVTAAGALVTAAGARGGARR